MSESPNRDEKGLTLSGRVMLRLFMEFNRALVAASKLGDKSDSNRLFSHPTIVIEIRSLLWIASEMAKRVGTYSEVEDYLKTHEKEDEETVLDGMKQVTMEILNAALEHSGIPKCLSCGKLKCPICRECHACSKDQSIDSHSMGPLGGFGHGPSSGGASN